MPLLQREAHDIQEDWNSHRIRFQKGKDRPCGVPNDLFDLPSMHGAQDMKHEVSHSDISFLKEKFDLGQDLDYLPQTFKEEADLFIKFTGRVLKLETATEIYEALVLHFSQ
ncbi:uncharacterized protein LOC116306494 [Actinia tenebrosa]|uniref:Uncharacterized protein LOC116306494 n=1 Tax=Actinia tenebrosa TaxID=6105 RepID=A0A6P8IZ14_ACTTE|nr:uncharacterized protein LOC116306494 [Actinia tenebrosa]